MSQIRIAKSTAGVDYLEIRPVGGWVLSCSLYQVSFTSYRIAPPTRGVSLPARSSPIQGVFGVLDTVDAADNLVFVTAGGNAVSNSAARIAGHGQIAGDDLL